MARFIKTTEGAAVQFPFELKDAFRKAIPSAKWNAVYKQWEVGSKSVKRLQQWIEQIEASGVEAEIAARDEADMSEKEVAALAADIAAVRRELEAARSATTAADESRARAEELRAQLEAAHAELEAAKAAKAAAEAAARAAADDVEARVAHIVTRARIDALRIEMKRNWIPKAYARKAFEEAQEELSKIDDALEAMGIYCRAIRLAVNANFNRKDRDAKDLWAGIEFEVAAVEAA